MRPIRFVTAAFGVALLTVAATTTAAPLAYVPNQKSGSISVIDTATDNVVRTLTAQGRLGKRLQAIDADPRGNTLYVVDAEHDNLVAIDAAHDTIAHTVAIGKDAEGVRLAPGGKLLAVCAEGQHLVLFVDARSFAITARIPVRGRNPEHCEFTPDGRWLLTSNEGSDNLDVIDVAARVSVATIATSGHPRGAAFVPRTSHLYVAQEAANGVDVIDVAARKRIATIPTALRAAGVTASEDGKRVYVANGGAGSVSVIDVAANAVVKEIAVGKRPWNMALTPDGRKLYVANGRSNSVSVIDTGKLAVIGEIPVGELPWGVLITR
ncbi:MAG: beta-propeller fold lactonase family protein [Lysobacterales bacterium]